MSSKRVVGKVQPEKSKDRSKYNFTIDIQGEDYNLKIETMGPYYVKITSDKGLAYYEVSIALYDYLRDEIFNFFGKDGADVMFECVGINATMDQAITYARKGSDIVVVGVFGDLGTINMGFVQDHELRLIGTAMYREEDYIKAIELVGEGKIAFDPLITDHIDFDEYKKAYDLIDQQKDKAMKVIIVMDKED